MHQQRLLSPLHLCAMAWLCLLIVMPTGAVRLVTGTEALTGFVLLSWSASFIFVEMQRFWRA